MGAKYEMPALTAEQRAELISDIRHCRGNYLDTEMMGRTLDIALAALISDTSELAELAAKVRKVRGDAADFDGDRRGMWEHQEEHEQLLLEEAVKYTAPPVPALKLPDEKESPFGTMDYDIYANDGWNDCLAEVKALNGVIE